MASYLEIRGLFNDGDLQNKIETAVVISAYNLTASTPTAAQKAWIASVFANPGNVGKSALMAVLAANKGLSVSAIQSATDAAIQTNVDNIVQTLIDAMSGS